MAQEILSVAIWEPIPEHEASALETFQELTSIVARKATAATCSTVTATIIMSFSATGIRIAAPLQEDPDMLRCWAKLGNEIQIVKVYETLMPYRWNSEVASGRYDSGFEFSWPVATHEMKGS
jgi:hypothetical protein